MLILTTGNGVAICRTEDPEPRIARRGLSGQAMTSVVADEGVILAGSRDGIFRSDDLGETWRRFGKGLSTSLVRWMAYHPDLSDHQFAGVEPAGIFRSQDGGESWRDCPEITPLREAGGWFLPYSPLAGCVRGFAFQGERGYAAVEVGGVLRSDDHGETWRLAGGSTGRAGFDMPNPGFVHPDVHSIAVHPSSPDLVAAPTARGLYLSHDGGESWNVFKAKTYCRAVWWDPDDVNHLLLGPAQDVSRDGSVEESFDGGVTWEPAVEGLDLPWPHRMVERFHWVDGWIYIVSNDGRLYRRDAEGSDSWHRVLPEIEGITAVAGWPEAGRPGLDVVGEADRPR